jgi:hypothetical protein
VIVKAVASGLDSPAVTVVIAARHRAGELGRVLGRLAALPEQPAVIVVGSASLDGAADLARRGYPGGRLIRPPPDRGAAPLPRQLRQAAPSEGPARDLSRTAAPAALVDTPAAARTPDDGHLPPPCSKNPSPASSAWP